MKRKVLLFALGVLMALPMLARDFEYEYEGQTLIYTVINEEDKTVCTKAGSRPDAVYTKPYSPGNKVSGKLVIPATVKDDQDVEYTVTEIGDVAFYDCPDLTSVSIPNSVTSIGSGAFRNCRGMTSVTIPNSVTSIGEGAFSDCRSLTSVSIPNSVTSIGEGAFSDCRSLTSVSIPNSVTSIASGAFRHCEGLTSVTIPNSVTSIGDEAFSCCFELTSVTIPNSVTSIGNWAFASCQGLTSVNIPNSVTSIGEAAFNDCRSLTSVSIPNSVTSLGNGAFEYCTGLTSVTIGNTSIGYKTFSECTGLASVTIGNSVTSIGERAFFFCTGLKELTFADGDTELDIDSTAFDLSGSSDPDQPALESMYLGRNVGPSAFQDWGINSLTIGHSVTSIGDKAFSNCRGLKGVTIADGDSELNIATTAFTQFEWFRPVGQPALETMYLGRSVGPSAFQDWGINSLTIGSSVASIGKDAFLDSDIENVRFKDWTNWYNNVKLANIGSNPYYKGAQVYADDIRVTEAPSLTEGITKINDYVNVGLPAYKNEVELPSTLKSIGAGAFYNNKELYHIFFNEGLEEIGDLAFFGCDLLENPKYPASLKKIGDKAFSECPLFTEITLPEGLNELGNGVFANCKKLEKAVLVADTDTLGDELFAECSALNKVFYPLNLKHIGNSCFFNCSSLDEAVFPATLETIGSNAFSNAALTKVTIPNSVTSIGSGAFLKNKISSLTIGKGLETIPESAFANNDLQIIKLSEGLKTIESNAFNNASSNCSEVILPSTVTKIASGAFTDFQMAELVIPDGVTSLEEASCGIPSVLTIGSSIKNIDAKAFSFNNLITLTVKATMPPTLSDAFPLTDTQNDKLTLIVNEGRKPYYVTNARWKQIENIIEDQTADITVQLDGKYPLAEEIRIQSGLMPSRVRSMKVVGPLSDSDLMIIKQNMAALRGIDLSEVTNLTEIPDDQFSGSLLSTAVLPKVTEKIGSDAFSDCRLLKMTSLPETVKSIGDGTFSGCSGVTFTNMPQSLESVGSNAFAYCSSLEEVSFGENLKTLSMGAFNSCGNLGKVDLGMTKIKSIENVAFRGCKELDEIVLPESLVTIEGRAFAGTAIRDLSFVPSGVSSIGNGAFSNCRRLVAANLPNGMDYVSSEIFNNCPRLLSVSMSSRTKGVGSNLVDGDRKVANISCAAIEAPEAANGAFEGLRFRYVSLTIPTNSFRSYLSAPQWGRFETILNTIDCSQDEGADVTNVAEDEYQDMQEEDNLEEQQEQAQQEQTQEEETTKMLRKRAVRRDAARSKTPLSFAALFDGARIQNGSDGSGTRIFINTKDGANLVSVKLNGKEIIDQLDPKDNSVLLPTGTNGTLEIRTDKGSGIDEVTEASYDEATAPVYNLTGAIVGYGKAVLDNLNTGIYIFCGKKIAVK